MSDLISRQAAIDALAEFVPYAICDESTESYCNGLTDAYNLILQLPSAEPKRKQGEWIEKCSYDGMRNYYYCTLCGVRNDWKSNFCPHCGVDMRKEE